MVLFPFCLISSLVRLFLTTAASEAFTTNIILQRQRCVSLCSTPFSGWDNDSFLDSLGGGGNDGEAVQQKQQAVERPSAATTMGAQQQTMSWSGTGYSPQQPQGYGRGESQGQGTAMQQQQQIQKQEVGALPLGWSAHFDPTSKQLYYYNVNDGTTTWERPSLPESSKEEQYMIYQQSLMTQDGTEGQPAEEEQDAEELPTENLEGAQLTDDMKAKMKASHTEEEDASQGGHKFRDMIERAKKTQPDILGHSTLRSPTPSTIPPNAMDLPVEEQARLFREMFWRQQHPEVQGRPQPTYQSADIGWDGRKIGRNRDADMISNASDVYLAQLKRDSTTRNLARYAGDDVKANAVFHDSSIAEIRGPEENPYLKERRERERDMLETVPDEMLLFQEYDSGEEEARQSYSGISYKDKMAQIKAKRQSSSSSSSSSSNN